MRPRYSTASVVGRRQIDDTPLTDGPVIIGKADWKNITERQRRGRNARRQVSAGKTVAGIGGAIASGAMGASIGAGRRPMQTLHEARHIVRMARGKGMSQFAGSKMSRVKETARETGREAMKYPEGALIAGGGATAGVGGGLYATGKIRERHHDNAIASQRKKRAVNKGLRSVIRGTKKVVPLPEPHIPAFAVKGGWRDARLDAREAAASDRGRFIAGRVGKAVGSPGATVRSLEATVSSARGGLGRAGRKAGQTRQSIFNNAERRVFAVRPNSGAFGTGRLQQTTAIGKAEVSKTRNYDPEHRRQRRLGMGQAALLMGGGTSAGFGVKGAMKDTETVRRGVSNGKNLKKLVAASPRNLALLGGGVAGVAGAGAIQQHANSRRGKGWD